MMLVDGAVEKRKPLYAFFPGLSLLYYLAYGLQEDHVNGKRLRVVLAKLTAHALYAALFTAYFIGAARTGEINPIKIMGEKNKQSTLENRVSFMQQIQYIDDKVYFL